MITKYKLFESKEINNPWSEFYKNKYPKLKELYNSLEIEIIDNEEWVILYHFSSAKLFKPTLDYDEILKQKIIDKYSDNYDRLEKEMDEVSFKPINMKDVIKFLTYPKFEIYKFYLNIFSKLFGFNLFDDFIKFIDEKIGDTATRSLNPKFFGSSKVTRNDQQQLPFKVIMFYTDLKDKENIFSYRDDLITIRYPLKKLYPMFTDPFNYHTEGNSIKNIMINAKNNGFSGDIVNWKNINNQDIYRCDIWCEILLTTIKDGKILKSKYLVDYKES